MPAPGTAAAQTLLKTITMPADIDASGQVPTGWLLARPRLGQCVTFTGRLVSSSGEDACVAIEAWCEERGRTGGTPLMRAQLRYVPATIEVPGNLFPGTFQAGS